MTAMRDDLLHAHASIDWAIAKLPAFGEEIESWLSANVDCRVEQLEPQLTHSPIIVKMKAPLPLSFNVESGVYINAIRSSLDILFTTLATRYGIGKPEDAYFPIAPSDTDFARGKYRGAKLVKGLPDIERAIIEGLEPYKGGNAPLFALHHLDIMRKHRRLLNVAVIPNYTISDTTGSGGLRPVGQFVIGNISAGFETRDFILFGGGSLSADHKSLLGLARNTTADYKFEFTAQITLNESTSAEPLEVIGTLREFASLAHSIIKLFDTP